LKWIETNIYTNKESQVNDVLVNFVKPYIDNLYNSINRISWHYFREPHIVFRIYGEDETIKIVKEELELLLNTFERNEPEIYYRHFFGAFCKEGDEYKGEAELYGEDAWELCYKRWETGSNLALQLLSKEPIKSIPFHYTRDIHLFENQLGFEYSDAITIYMKWVKRLMECLPDEYKEQIPIIDKMIVDTWKESLIKGI
jgi:hypothetical protein